MSEYSYNTLEKRCASRLTVKASKFYGYGFPVHTEEEIKAALQQIEEEHPKARHHCYAWRLGLDKNHYRVNDAGEPSGSAGRPILNQIDSAQITNSLIVVVRYFGGTKLGIPGLIKAYKQCTQETIEAGNTITQEVQNQIQLNVPYQQINSFHQILAKLPASLLKESFSDTTGSFTLSFSKSNENKVIEACKTWIIQTQ